MEKTFLKSHEQLGAVHCFGECIINILDSRRITQMSFCRSLFEPCILMKTCHFIYPSNDFTVCLFVFTILCASAYHLVAKRMNISFWCIRNEIKGCPSYVSIPLLFNQWSNSSIYGQFKNLEWQWLCQHKHDINRSHQSTYNVQVSTTNPPRHHSAHQSFPAASLPCCLKWFPTNIHTFLPWLQK